MHVFRNYWTDSTFAVLACHLSYVKIFLFKKMYIFGTQSIALYIHVCTSSFCFLVAHSTVVEHPFYIPL